jgi:signal peptide peptidase SppA
METVLAIDPSAWQRMQAAPAAARVVAPEPFRGGDAAGSILVLPIYGVLRHRQNWLAALFGGTDSEMLAALIRLAVDDPAVKEIILDVSSPGGEVAGTEELAAAVANARTRKRVTAVVDALAASAAYWVASAATQLVSTPSGLTGGVGVYGTHVDLSELERKAGIKVSLIGAPAGKTDGSEHEPLSERARKAMQANVDAFYDQFVARVAAGRGIPPAMVRGERFGQGRVFTATEAQRRGLVDAVATLPEVVASAARRAGGADVEYRLRRLRAFARGSDSPQGRRLDADLTARLRRGQAARADLERRRLRARQLGVAV